MRVTTKAVFDMESGALLECEGYDYDGPVEHCGGGPSVQQRAAQAQTLSNAQQEGKLADQSAVKFNDSFSDVNPFYESEMTKGLPFYNSLTDFNSGTTARAYNPARAAFLRSTSGMGALPSGFRAAGLSDINEAQAHDFDSSLVDSMRANYQAKEAGGAGKVGLMNTVNPSAFYGGSTSAGSSAMQPLQVQPNQLMGLFGGIAGGVVGDPNFGRRVPKLPGSAADDSDNPWQ
jgi:hypothetical protein